MFLIFEKEKVEMATLIDVLAGRKNVRREQEEGIGLAIQTIEEFKDRTFSFQETQPDSGIPADELIRFIQEDLPSYYNYSGRVKKYVDSAGIAQAVIEIRGTIGMSKRQKRYNPLNRIFHIKAEQPALEKHTVNRLGDLLKKNRQIT